MVRNIIGVIVGILVSFVVNMGFIAIGPALIPLPEGVDNSSLARLAETIHLFEPKNFLIPFLAHALGPLVGTFVTMLIAVSHKMKIAIGMAVFFLLGGIAANVMIPAPVWYKAVDLIFAYLPTTLAGARLGGAGKESHG
ncbi:MAG: hypothetical protein ABIR33_13530 [Pyrinomonadaceae bacterium]